MIWYLVGATLGVVYLGFCVWFAFEVITAPLVDEDGRVISDPHHSMAETMVAELVPEATPSSTRDAGASPSAGR